MSSSAVLKVPSSLAAFAHGMFAAPAMWPGTCDCSCGRWSGASFSPRYSSGERTSTKPTAPTFAITSSRSARISGRSAPLIVNPVAA